MLKGQEFGKAIGVAIKKKLENGSVKSKAAIARHFGMQPPSLVDWVKKGAVSKDKLPELWRFFSDVAGPDHWGLSDSEWPIGLSEPVANYVSSDSADYVITPTGKKIRKIKRKQDSSIVLEVIEQMEKMDFNAQSLLLERAKALAELFPANKQVVSSQ